MKQAEMKKVLIILSVLTLFCAKVSAQSAIVRDFRPSCDSLCVLLNERSGIDGKLRLKAIMKRGKTLDFYFTESLGDHPLREGDAQWFRKTLKQLFPRKWQGYSIGGIYTKHIAPEKLETPALGFSGNPSPSPRRISPPSGYVRPVSEKDGMIFDKGLSGRTIALWQSHGMYYDTNDERWQWQRPCLFTTVEDLYTSAYVLPFLVPMLENAGAYVMLPRERDTQISEVISDNDPLLGGRGSAAYAESGKWEDAGCGFADAKPVYTGTQSPFSMGTARKATCISSETKGQAARAEWRPDIPQRGRYAVYVSYKSLPESTSAAHYTVVHLGGTSEFIVNQRIGGGMWTYLGTFEFDKGTEGYVSLSSRTPQGHSFKKGNVVTADAVRFGGGMGCIARGDSDSTACISGMPRYAEGARYSLQWSGADKELYSQNDMCNDYKDDFMSRGDWVDWISGGSCMNPGRSGKGIPVDLALGFHSDAGVTPDDSIVGTLAIYTLKSEGRETLPDGESRMASREYADLVQSQIVHDIRIMHNSEWTRRELWDRGYRESRTPSSPSMLLELLSHQNFEDMKYGLDPAFRFTVCRAVYKGMLKYLSNRYGCRYQVQPLPVHSMAISPADEGKAIVSWEDTADPAEPTARAKGHILYTRIDDGAFDSGKVLRETHKTDGRNWAEVSIEPGHIYSFRIAAYNDGGISFPSETLCIGIPSGNADKRAVLVVNNFSRVSGPAFFDTPSYGGFTHEIDRGVPYISDISYIGDMYEMRRGAQWLSNDNPGFGASWSSYAGKKLAGNTFDYPYVHGKAIMKTGHPFFSCSSEAFCTESSLMEKAWSMDLICGKQVTVPSAADSAAFAVFPQELQQAIRSFTSKGGNVLVSGAHIGTDIWDSVYPAVKDSRQTESAKAFAQGVLGFKWVRNNASRTGEVAFERNCTTVTDSLRTMAFHTEPNEELYCVEAPDGIAPAGSGETMMRYADTGIPAAARCSRNGYRTVCIGFPIETLKEEDSIDCIISATFEFFRQ